jgi:hypothetical protein
MLRDEYQVTLTPEYDKDTDDIAPSELVLFSLYVDYDTFRGQSFSHPLKARPVTPIYVALLTHVVYFAPLVLVCRSSCGTAEAGKESLRKGLRESALRFSTILPQLVAA